MACAQGSELESPQLHQEVGANRPGSPTLLSACHRVLAEASAHGQSVPIFQQLAVIRLIVMMYVRFPLSLRNVEDLLAERGVDISHKTVGFW
jgi:transposase-like protein